MQKRKRSKRGNEEEVMKKDSLKFPGISKLVWKIQAKIIGRMQYAEKRILCTSAALLAAISLIMPNQGYAKAKKPVLSKKKLTMSVGESKTLKVKNTKKR